MFCIKCGKQIPDDSVFCMGCGTKVPRWEQTTEKEKTPAPMETVKKENFSKPVFDDEATKAIVTKKIVDDDEKTRVVLPPKTKSFESIIETPVEKEMDDNEIFSHSEPQEIDIFSNSEEKSIEVLTNVKEVADVFSNSKDESVEVFTTDDENDEIFSNSVEEPTDIFSNSEDAENDETFDSVEDAEEIFSHSDSVPRVEMAKPQMVEDFEDEKTVFIGANESSTSENEEKAPESPVIDRPVAPPVVPPVRPVAPPVGPPVAPPVRPVAPPIAPPVRPVTPPVGKGSEMTVTMSRNMDPIPKNYGVPMRESNVVRPNVANSFEQNPSLMNEINPANNFVPEPVKKKRKRIHPMAIILPIVAVILALAIVFGSLYLFTDPKDRYYVSKKVEVNYDEDGNVTSKFTREYFAEGILSLYKHEYDGEVYDQDKYERDEDGRIIKLTEGVGDDKKVFNFTYEKDGKLYVATGKCTKDEVTYKIEYAYEKDELVRTKEYEDNVLTFSSEKEGNVETNKYFEDGELKRTYIYEYDKKDNLIRREYKDETDPSENYVDTYIYDKKENLLEYNSTNSDGDVTERVVYEYDKNGNQTSGVSYGEDGEIEESFTATYNKYDVVIEAEILDENDEVAVYVKLRSESKDKIIVDYFDKDDKLIYYNEYTIEKNKLTEAKRYNGTTEKLEQSVTYNKDGLVLEEKNYYENGKLSSKTTYEYAKK